MKWNTLLATLVLAFVCSQANAAGLLNQMLGTGCGCDTSCCQTPKCCSPKPRCCMPKPTCCAPAAATCCAPEPTCCAPEACGCGAPEASCCAPEATCAAPAACGGCGSCCKKKCCTPLKDALENLFCCKKSCCHTSCCAAEPSCAAPEATCCAPSACGCGAPEASCCAPEACGCEAEATCGAPACGGCGSSCGSCHKHSCGIFAPKCGCKSSCTPLKDAINRLFCFPGLCCHKKSCGCGSSCGDTGCGDSCGCGVISAPAGTPTEADSMPPAPVPAETMTYVPARRRLAAN